MTGPVQKPTINPELVVRAKEYRTTVYKMANGAVLDADHTLIRRDLDEMCDAVVALSEACLYLAGYDVGGWEGHMRDEEVLAKVGLR